MRATLVRVALLATFAGIAAPVAAQRTGPCPPAAFAAPAGPRPSPDPIDCLFAPNGDVRAALYPATVFESSGRVHVFRGDAPYRASWSDHPDEVLTVAHVNRFSELDPTTLERIEGAAELQESALDGPTLRLASYAPTTPSTQSATTDLRVIGRTYDDFDRLSRETVPLQDGRTATVSYTYWNNGQRKTVTDVLGGVTFYEYDGQNRLSRLTANQGLPDERVTTYAYWPDSLLKSVAKPDGTVTSYDYDRADRLESIAVRKGDTELLSYAYTYDRNGNRTLQVETNGGAPETTTYTYDDLNRLETVTYPDGRRVAYGYDAVGNRTGETERDPAGTVTSEKVAVFDAANRLSTVTDAVNPANNATFAYDTNGNLERKTTAAGAETYTYDIRDQLVETRAGASITGRFACDAFGRRYLKIGSEGVRQYLYDQTSLLEEFNDVGTEVVKYDWAADRLVSLARLEEPRRFFHFDALGSVVALTEESGSVAARYHYDAWGRHRDAAELDASANRFGFTGHYFDTETKLYYAKARYFDPDFGRFLTADSYLGEIGDPPSLNRYVYANANPTTFVDPTGFASVLAGRLEDVGPILESRAAGYEARDPATATFMSPRQVEQQAKADANKSKRVKIEGKLAEQQLGRLDQLSAGGFSHYAEITIEESDFKDGQLDHSKILAAVEAQTGTYASQEIPGLAAALSQALEGAAAGERRDISEMYSLAYNASKARAESVASEFGPSGSIQGLSALIGQGEYAPRDVVLDAQLGLGGRTVDYATLGLVAYQTSRSIYGAAKAAIQENFAAAPTSVAASPVNQTVGSGNAFGAAADTFRGFRLRALGRQAAAEVDIAIAAGDARALVRLGASPAEVARALGPGGERFRGSIIDQLAKERARDTWGLRGLRYTERFEYGPDVWNPSTLRAWDITTPGKWPEHVRQYITAPPAARPVWRSLAPVMTK